MSLKIGKFVYSELSTSTSVNQLAKGRIFPVLDRQGVSGFPFIEFQCRTGEPEYTKDGASQFPGDNHSIVVRCVSKSYDEVLDLADRVRKTLELCRDVCSDFTVTDCYLLDCEDTYEEALDAFVEVVTFYAESTDNDED